MKHKFKHLECFKLLLIPKINKFEDFKQKLIKVTIIECKVTV